MPLPPPTMKDSTRQVLSALLQADETVTGEQATLSQEEGKRVRQQNQQPAQGWEEPPNDPVGSPLHAQSSSPSEYCPTTEPAPGTSRKYERQARSRSSIDSDGCVFSYFAMLQTVSTISLGWQPLGAIRSRS